MATISPQAYCRLANGPDSGLGYSVLPDALLAAEKTVVQHDPLAAAALNKGLCDSLLQQFTLKDIPWRLPAKFELLYQKQLSRIENQLNNQPDSYFSFAHDPFRKDLAILRHRLIPYGAELATPFSGISRRLLLTGGGGQAAKFLRTLTATRGFSPLLELHMHPHDTAEFTPQGWLDTYENLADFLAVNPSLLGVQSTSWFLDPALEEVSPHLTYLRAVPEGSGAAFFYAGEDDKYSGAFETSQTRRELFRAGSYRPRLFTRIWPRKKLLQRAWRSMP